MAKVDDLLKAIDDVEIRWQKDVGKVELSLWRKVSAALKDLDTDGDGNIRRNVANLKRLGRLDRLIKNNLYSKDYKRALDSLSGSYAEIRTMHQDYFESIGSVEVLRTALVDEMQKQARNTIISQMNQTGAVKQVSGEIADLIEKDIRAGRSFAELQDNVKDIIRGNKNVPGRLQAYTGQLVTDGLNQFAASVNAQFSDDLGLDWFIYVGGIIATTRPFCKALSQKRYVHRSEFGAVAAARINGAQVSKAGMINPTTAENLTVVRGGHFCRHQLYAISESSVPKGIREKFE